MVSSSLDKNIRKALTKDNLDPSNTINTNTNNSGINNSGANFSGERLPPNDKIQLLFPKCKPRNDYQYQTSLTASTATTQETSNLVSVASSSSQAIQLSNTLLADNFNMNNSKHIKLLSQISPDHNKSYSSAQLSDHAKKLKTNNKYEPIDNYADTNPFRTDSNNQYFYTPNDSLFDNNNSALAPTENTSMMHHYHYPPYSHRSYQRNLEDRSYFFEPDEIEHNPYMVQQQDSMPSGTMINTVPSSILKSSPPATPPALTTTPIDSSPMGNRNIWDLSPIKHATPTRINTHSPIPFMRSHKASHHKILSSPPPAPIEDLETGHFYYNNKKPYYQPSQVDSDSNEPVTVTDLKEVEKPPRVDLLHSKSKIKHSESTDYIYSEVKKKEERKIPKSKSGSGIMEYDGSPRRFGTSSNEDLDNQYPFSKSSLHQVKTAPSSSSYNNYSPSGISPRPGFPQRVVPSQYSRNESPSDSLKHYQYGDQKVISQLIPTTLINYNSASETTQSKPLTIYEESHDILFDEKPLTTREVTEKCEVSQSEIVDNTTTFQVTSPTEEYIPTSTFDYLYEFSETRKVLEEFFKCPETDKIKELEKFSDFNESDDSLDIQYDYRGQIEKEMEKIYSKQITPTFVKQERDIDDDNRDDKDDEVEENAYMKTKQNGLAMEELKEKSKQLGGQFVDSTSRSSLGEDKTENENDFDNSRNKRNRRMSKSLTNNNYFRTQSKNFNYSPDTTDYDSNYGDFEFERESPLRFLAPDYTSIPQQYNTLTTATIPSATVDLSGGPINNYARYCTSMPVLEDGLSSGHASDNENNNQVAPAIDIHSLNKRKSYGSSISTIQKQYQDNLVQNQTGSLLNNSSENNRDNNCHNGNNRFIVTTSNKNILNNNNNNIENDFKMRSAQSPPSYHPYYPMGGVGQDKDSILNASNNILNNKFSTKGRDPDLESLYTINTLQQHTPPPPAPVPHRQTLNETTKAISPLKQDTDIHSALKDIRTTLQKSKINNAETSPTHHYNNNNNCNGADYNDRISVLEKAAESPAASISPVWIPRSRDKSALSPMLREASPLISKQKYKDEDDDDVDTDLETDRLLGHQLLDDGFYDDKAWAEPKQHKSLLPSTLTSKISPKINQHSAIPKSNSSSIIRHGLNALIPPSSSSDCCVNSPSMSNANTFYQSRSLKTSPSMNNNETLLDNQSELVPSRKVDHLDEPKDEHPTRSINNNVPETTDLCNLESELVDSPGGSSSDKSKKDEVAADDKKKRNKNKEVLIEGVLFRARYLGSTQLVCEGQPTKSTRMMQAEEAVSRIKALAPDGENQPSTEVDLFISTEKIMVLNTDLKEIMMDHALRTISYIADIGDLVVLMARRRFVPQDIEANSDSGTGTGGSGNVSGGSGGPTPPTSGKINRTPKMICHVFESGEASFIASSIGNAFQVAYMEFLKANGIEDHSFMKEMDYQEVLNSQEIFGDELEIFAKKELQKEVVVPKAKGEILGVVIVESGWGSMLPTVVIANLASNGAAARCGQLNIGDQIIAINGLSLVGLPLSQCQTYIKNTKNQTVVKFTVVPCAPVVEVKIKRPNTKYQLGFSVQNGVICSLLRGGIAERGGVRVGHRIIEINNQSVVAVPHEKIVNLLATSVGEILMKTMPTSMFRLLTGQENPIYI